MDAPKETKVGDLRTVYIPPCVVRINEMKWGAGYCATQGSGDRDGCTPTGSTAAEGGCGTGNNPNGRCDPTGNGRY